VRSFFDQLVRADALSKSKRKKIAKAIDKAGKAADRGRSRKARKVLLHLARDLRGPVLADLRDAVRDLAATFPGRRQRRRKQGRRRGRRRLIAGCVPG
jgi:hypothetical protein